MLKKWIQRLFRFEGDSQRDWRTDNSLFQFISGRIDHTGRLPENTPDLPDDARAEDEVRFAPGLMDAMLGADTSGDSRTRIDELVTHLKKVAFEGDPDSGAAFYRLVTQNDTAIGIIDDFLQALIDAAPPIEPYLFPYACDLLKRSGKRNAVKFGAAILGLCQNKSVLHDLKIAGLHDEFTLYAVVALINLSGAPVNDLWELAQKVDGWGKIQVVSRLADMTLNDEVRDWLVMDGYRNSIMNEYLAFTCATQGLLHEKLEAEKISRRLFKAAADLIKALISGGPAEDISGYEHAASVVGHFLRHAGQHAADVTDFVTLHNIKAFLLQLQEDLGDHEGNGWTQDNISNCLIETVTILNSRNWEHVTSEALQSDDAVMYWDAKRAAEILGMDIWDTIWNKLQQNPVDFVAWYDATRYAQPEHADQLITFALARLPLAELTTGPQNATGFGPDYPKFGSLDVITGYLENFPGKGEKIVLAALKCPVTRNRNTALKVLAAWPRDTWPPAITAALQHLRGIEPDHNTKESIEKLLSTGALP